MPAIAPFTTALLLNIIHAAAMAESSTGYSIQPVPFTAVQLRDAFWAPRLETNRKVTIPHNLRELERQGSLGGFALLAGQKAEKYHGYMWGDSDVYKTIEGAIYSLQTHPDPALQNRIEGIVATIVASQAPDGYLMPHLQLAEPKYGHFTEETTRTCESYSIGHAIESAVAHYQATGKRSYLDAAIRCAGLLARVQAEGKLEQISGHPQIELALVKLYRATRDRKHLDLAARYVAGAKEHSGIWSGGKPLLSHGEAMGHSVAACYLHCGATDVAVHTGDTALLELLDRKWENLVAKKLFVTGGIGLPAGEGFGRDYELPNAGAYCETCASIALALWDHRLFLAHGDAKYLDILERSLYNGFLAGVGLSGDRFFYPNPLTVTGRAGYQRVPWFGCPCCPVNVVRFIPQVPGFVYATQADDVFVNLFAAGQGKVRLAGQTITFRQDTRYPWDGEVKISIQPERPTTFSLRVRIPGWAQGRPIPSDLYRYVGRVSSLPTSDRTASVSPTVLASAPPIGLKLNGQPVAMELQDGFARIHRQWKPSDTIELSLPMPIRRVLAHEAVEEDAGRVALERGPIVYCAEGVDHGGRVLNLTLPDDATLKAEYRHEMLGGIAVLTGPALAAQRTVEGGTATRPATLTAVPYYAWNHRGPSEMTVWLARTADKTTPLPPKTIAGQSNPSASHCWRLDTVEALNSGILPPNSHDLGPSRLTWWDHRGTKEWAQYDFHQPAQVTSVEVYWFDDTGTGGCRVPQSWQVLYRDGGRWKPVEPTSRYGTKTDVFNRTTFRPVRTDGLRIEVQLQPGFSGGMLQWRVD